MMELVNLAQDYGVFLLRFHFYDHGHHSKPHRLVCDEPDRRRGEDRQDGAGEETPGTDFSQRASEDDLGRDGGRGNERDEPQPLDPSIVDRRLSQMEQPMVPLGDAAPHRHAPSSTPSVYDDFRLSIRPVLSTGRTIRPAFHGDFAHTASSQSLNGRADESFPFGPF